MCLSFEDLLPLSKLQSIVRVVALDHFWNADPLRRTDGLVKPSMRMEMAQCHRKACKGNAPVGRRRDCRRQGHSRQGNQLFESAPFSSSRSQPGPRDRCQYRSPRMPLTQDSGLDPGCGRKDGGIFRQLNDPAAGATRLDTIGGPFVTWLQALPR